MRESSSSSLACPRRSPLDARRPVPDRIPRAASAEEVERSARAQPPAASHGEACDKKEPTHLVEILLLLVVVLGGGAILLALGGWKLLGPPRPTSGERLKCSGGRDETLACAPKALARAWSRLCSRCSPIPGVSPVVIRLAKNLFRSVDPGRVAGAALFLASTASESVTGVCLPLDGGCPTRSRLDSAPAAEPGCSGVMLVVWLRAEAELLHEPVGLSGPLGVVCLDSGDLLADPRGDEAE